MSISLLPLSSRGIVTLITLFAKSAEGLLKAAVSNSLLCLLLDTSNSAPVYVDPAKEGGGEGRKERGKGSMH